MKVHKNRQGHAMGDFAVDGHLAEANYIKFQRKSGDNLGESVSAHDLQVHASAHSSQLSCLVVSREQ